MESNPRGIPKAPFVEDVATFIQDATVESILSKLQETLSKYKFMEINLIQRHKTLSTKIPEIQASLDVVSVLGDDEKEVHYELNPSLYAHARIPAQPPIYLWLGANVMLEYSMEEAKELLTQKLEATKASLVVVEEDMDFLREQITTMEVNVARVHNWDVKQRREAAAAAENAVVA